MYYQGSIPGRGKYFSQLYGIEAQAHPASYPRGTRGLSSREQSIWIVKMTARVYLVSRPRRVKLYLHSYIHLHVVVIQYWSMGAIYMLWKSAL
jgi:hypothetical protein